MATKTKEEVIQEIKNYIDKFGLSYSSWVIGITNDAKATLFNSHKVDRESGKWIYRTVESNDTVNSIKKYFIDLGLENFSNNSAPEYNIVYAYKKATGTNP